MATNDRAHGGSETSHVPMLDGIRAFAVVGTMAFHAGVLVPRGGFFAVDCFFTLSGFLITTLLVREWESRGRIALVAFWNRRARRLLPGLFLMLAALAVYSGLAHQSGRWPTLGSDEVSSLLYFANWHFLATGADYFNQTKSSPVNHTWSLAIEEQFYLIWPLVALVCLRLRRGRLALLLLAAAGTVASAIEMAVLYRPDNVSRVYYGTDTRAQSLLIGATLAMMMSLVSTSLKRPGLVPRAAVQTGSARGAVSLKALGWAGLAGSAAIWIGLSSSSPLTYLGGFGLAGCATCAVIASVMLQPVSLLARLLSLRPLQFLGRISYGMYLWHYPLFLIITGQRTRLMGYPLFAARSAVTVLVATASYYLLEQPVRRMRRTAHLGQKVLIAAGGVATATIVLASGLPTGGDPASAASRAQMAGSTPGVSVTSTRARVLIVGDSLAKTLGNGVSRNAKLFFGNEELLTGGLASTGPYFGLDVINGGTVNCALTTGLYRVGNATPQKPFGACNPSPGQPARPADWAAMVAKTKPEVSLFISRLDIADHLFDGRWTHIGDPAYDTYLLGQIEKAVEVLTSAGGKVILCTTPYFSTGEQPDGRPFPEDNPVRVDRYNAMLREVANRHPGRVFIFDLNALIDAGRTPLTTIDGVTVRFSDGIHFTPAGDCWLAPRILPFVEKITSPTGAVTKAPPSVPASVCTDVAETASF